MSFSSNAGVLSAQGLFEQRYTKVGGYWLLLLFPFWFWYLWAGWPGNPSPEESRSYPARGVAAISLWIPCHFVLYWQQTHAWAVVGIGLISAVAVAMMVKSRYKSCAITFIGWNLAIPTVFFLEWPNGQRFMLVLVLGGLTTAFQGGLRFARALRVIRTPSTLGAADSC